MRIEVISRTRHRPKFQVVIIKGTGKKNEKQQELFSSKTLHVSGAELSAMESNSRNGAGNDTQRV